MSAPHLLCLSLAVVAASILSSPSIASHHHSCSPATKKDEPCPPFHSPPNSFPFSSSSGCGHPSFQIRCSSPHSLLSINSHTYLILNYSHPNSLTLIPSLPIHAVNSSSSSSINPSLGSSCPSLPTHPINLSNTPFRLIPDPCPLLFSLRPCISPPPSSSSNLFFCFFTPFQSQILSQPPLLISSCSASLPPSLPRRPTTTPCDHPKDIAAFISAFLRTGIRVEWDPFSDPYFTDCSSCLNSTKDAAACGFNASIPSKPFLCFPPHLSRQTHSPTPQRRLLLLFTVILTSTCLLALFFYAAAALHRRRFGTGNDDEYGDSVMMTTFLHRHQQSLQPPLFTYDQLRSSTNGFDPHRKIGDGGFGSVYLAQLDDGRIAAVKRLHRHHPNAASTKSFCNEILILSSLRHPNLVRLHGYCCDPRGLLLVYDYVPNGTLADHLHGSRSLYRKPSLTWPVRVDVALQTASALEYLHSSLKPPVVHRDITSSNIFVERDMRIKVGDFGLSRLLSLPDPNSAAAGTCSSSEYVCCTGPQGTPGYLDPDYHRSFRLTEKSDVYSFGVVLLELVTGMKAVDLRREKREMSLADLAVAKIQVGALGEVVDPMLVRGAEGEEAMAMGTVEAVAELAFRCVAGEKDDRPDAREIVEELKRIRSQLLDDDAAAAAAAAKGSS